MSVLQHEDADQQPDRLKSHDIQVHPKIGGFRAFFSVGDLGGFLEIYLRVFRGLQTRLGPRVRIPLSPTSSLVSVQRLRETGPIQQEFRPFGDNQGPEFVSTSDLVSEKIAWNRVISPTRIFRVPIRLGIHFLDLQLHAKLTRSDASGKAGFCLVTGV